MKIVAIIPARGGSKGVPRKNIKLLAGKPLIAHTIEAALKSKYIDRIIVSTEDDEIASISMQFGAEVIKRPDELAQDETKTAPVVKHVISELEHSGYSPDIIVLLQVTCPLRNEVIIDGALEKLINSEKDSIFTGFLAYSSMPLWKKDLKGNLQPLYDHHLRPRRQENHLREYIYSENGALYAVKREAYKKTYDFLGDDPEVYPININIDIDTPEDFARAEEALLKMNTQTSSDALNKIN